MNSNLIFSLFCIASEDLNHMDHFYDNCMVLFVILWAWESLVTIAFLEKSKGWNVNAGMKQFK